MIISFSVFKEKILDGTKTQTIRRYSEFQYKRFCNAKKYQLYWGNPRNGGMLIKEVEPSEKPFLLNFERRDDSIVGKYVGIKYDEKNEMEYNYQPLRLAKKDGFFLYDEMIEWFEKRYGKDMFTKKFMVLRWKP